MKMIPQQYVPCGHMMKLKQRGDQRQGDMYQRL